MATTYYLRTLQTQFYSNWEDTVYPDNSGLMFRFYSNNVSIGGKTNFISHTGQQFYHIAESGEVSFPDYKDISPSIKAISVESSVFNHITIDDSYHRSSSNGFNASGWEQYGWANPTSAYSTWKTQVCTYFENNKGALAAYGVDNNQVNVYVFKWSYANSFQGVAYFPLFFKGNDPYRDETIVI